MTTREYGAICAQGHRTYMRLDTAEPAEFGRCSRCGEPARLTLLNPVEGRPGYQETWR